MEGVCGCVSYIKSKNAVGSCEHSNLPINSQTSGSSYPQPHPPNAPPAQEEGKKKHEHKNPLQTRPHLPTLLPPPAAAHQQPRPGPADSAALPARAAGPPHPARQRHLHSRLLRGDAVRGRRHTAASRPSHLRLRRSTRTPQPRSWPAAAVPHAPVFGAVAAAAPLRPPSALDSVADCLAYVRTARHRSLRRIRGRLPTG